MSEAFNPYREWLGLEGDVETPHFYQLLGVELFEEDRAQLTAAADKALVRVRGFRPGSHAAAWAKLLDELSQAKTCFQDPARKSVYDDNLRRLLQHEPRTEPARDIAPPIAEVNQNPDYYPPGMAPKTLVSTDGASTNGSPATVSPARNPYPPGTAPVLEGIVAAPAPAAKPRPRPHPLPPPAGAGSRSTVPAADAASDDSAVRVPVPPGPVNAHVAPPRETPASLLPLAAAVAGVLIVVTMIILMIALRDDASGSAPVVRDPLTSPAVGVPDENRKVPDAKVAQPFVPSTPAATQPAAKKLPAAPSHPVPPPTNQEPPAATSDPTTPLTVGDTNLAALSESLQQARSAIIDHEYRVADRVLQKAGTLATSPEHRVMVERLRHLGQCAEQFWKVVANATRRLNAADELTIGSAEKVVVIVVETGQDSVTIHKDGRNVKYTLVDMPAGLALAIARRTADENDAQTLVLFGACLATAKDLTPAYVAEAQRYWEQAKLRGADVDDLLDLLADKD